MENFTRVDFGFMGGVCPGSDIFNFLECKFCGLQSIKSEVVRFRESGPACLRCYIEHTPVRQVDIYTKASDFVLSDGCTSDDSGEENSNARLTTEESITDSSVESEVESSSGGTIDSTGYLGESEDSDADTICDEDLQADGLSSDIAVLEDVRHSLEVESSEKSEKEDAGSDYDSFEVNSVSGSSGSLEVTEEDLLKLNINIDALSLRKRHRSQNSSYSDNDEKIVKRMKSTQSSPEDGEPLSSDDNSIVSEYDVINLENDFSSSNGDAIPPPSPTRDQKESRDVEVDHVTFDGVFHFDSQDMNGSVEGALADIIYANYDDVNGQGLKPGRSSSDDGFFSGKINLAEVSPDVIMTLPNGADDACHGNDAANMEKNGSSGLQ